MQPLLPLDGIAGFRFLERSLADQQNRFAAGPLVERELGYFRERIADIQSAEELVGDYRLLRVALGAFGLGDEVDKRFFLRRILEEGTGSPDALARKLVDPRYREFSAAFGFGDPGGARTGLPGFAEAIAEQYKVREFEVAVGEQNTDFRLALELKRDIGAIAASPSASTAGWFRVMGSTPLRTVFEAALNLPGQVAQLDIERQRDVFEERALAVFGDRGVDQFTDPGKVDRLIERFFAVRSVDQSAVQSPLVGLFQPLAPLQSTGSQNRFTARLLP
ncbi:DUF1217 domain-containing protein [Pontivivens ytuae]|uniref:DUF1217 domain-containing protein n=1 Tax=Pontivivens ytuae TaxID=2789856 RepID=A0A7S9LPZ3_9RHOB|nr:DUF1217 domain-containing protein [Pontivivens ytuae]QPH53082.1 DUF1217 domain-containing protein [Pontivivens ytuae]